MNCPTGKVPLGGGISIAPTTGANATRITLPHVATDRDRLVKASAVITANFTGGTTASVTAFAICAIVT